MTSDRPVSLPPAEPPRLRWPIHLQLLLPMVLVVLLASLLATAITAYWIARRVRGDQCDNLRRVAETLGNSGYPLTQQIIVQVKGLSGAEFVLTAKGRVVESTLPVPPAWLEELERVAASRTSDKATRTLTVSFDERQYLMDFVRFERRAHFPEPATLFILYAEDQLASRIRQAVYPALLAGLIAAGVAAAITTWLARRFTRPIRTLVAQTATIAQGDFTPMPVGRRNDEICDLVESINRMTVRLAAHQTEVRRHERLETLGRLGASMAHQLRNAATGGRMAIELHRRSCPHGAADESLDVALRQLRLMESYLRQFLSFGEMAPAVCRQIELRSVVEEAIGLVRPSCIHAGVDLQLTMPSQPLWLEGDPDSLRQLATNLILNAVDAAVAGNAVPPRVWVDLVQQPQGRGVLRVRDTGPGPAESVQPQLFHSFVTTKPDGFGLGLFVAHQIAQRHGGRLSWRREGETTCFEFEFPCHTS
jgi:signal transduction histidine kinase